MAHYENSLQHLLDEFSRIGLLIRLAVMRWRTQHKEIDEFRGLYISEEEIDKIFEAPFDQDSEDFDLKKLLDAIGILNKEIARRKEESRKKGIVLKLDLLSELFDLDFFEREALLICLAPEIDLKYERLFSYLQNDITKKRPTVDLILNLLCSSLEEKIYARKYFSDEASLIKNHILNIFEEYPERKSILLSKFLKVDEKIINFLIDYDGIDSRIILFTEKKDPKISFKNLILEKDLKDKIEQLISYLEKIESENGFIFFFKGPYGAGKKTTAESICKELNIPILVVDVKKMLNSNEVPFETLCNIIFREALLQNSSIYIDNFHVLLSDDEKMDPLRKKLIKELEIFKGHSFLSSESSWEPSGVLEDRAFIKVEFPVPAYFLRKKMWESYLDGEEELDANAIADKFRFTGGQIKDSIFTARNLARIKNPEDFKITMEDIYQGCKAQSNQNLSNFSRKINPHFKWDDIILPKDKKDQLKEICNYVKYRAKIFYDWGFDKKLSLGKGLNILFTGASGTGKTMAAEIIAGELNLDLYKADLSCVVSKYIGETEKNLSKIFKEAETSNAILFFDEADALFGKRSEVKDSHDRYANIEINYLLQKMEEHEGIVILASNLSKNIDEAFQRRMHFTVEFPFPDEEYREKIWRSIFPKQAPVEENLDYRFLSKKFKISGGNIKNIAVTAAFLAAENSGKIRMDDIIRATKREFQKIGKICSQSDFGEYYDLIIS